MQPRQPRRPAPSRRAASPSRTTPGTRAPRSPAAGLRPRVDDRARAAIDAIEVPISVTSAVRDRDGRLLDFRLEAVNVAAALWAGLDRAAVHGRLATDLLPGLRSAGLFDELERVVKTGRPFRQRGRYEGSVEAGRRFDATYDLMAVQHGDGYASAWAERDEEAELTADLGAVLDQVRAAMPLVRPEASTTSADLRPSA